MTLSYEQWLEENEQWLIEYAAETGANRELDFDMESFQDALYAEYIDVK